MNYLLENQIKFRIKNQYWILALVFLLPTPFYAQEEKENIDSLEMLLHSSAGTGIDLFPVYKKLTNAYLYTDNEKSMEYARQGVLYAGKKNNSYQIAEFYYNLGNSYYAANRLDSSLFYYEQSFDMLKHAKEIDMEDKKNIDYLQLMLFQSVGVINNVRGKYDEALDNLFKALDIAEKINTPQRMAGIYSNLATTYERMSNYRQAEIYYLKNEKLSRELNDSINLADAFMGLCNLYKNKKDYRKALEYGEEAYRIQSALPDVSADERMFTNQVLSDVWLQVPDYGKALEYAQKTVEYARQTTISSYLATALYMLSTCYLKQEKYAESEKIALEALTTDTTDIYINSILYGNITQANIQLGNPAKAIEYFGKTTDAIRAYSNKNFQSSLSEMEVKYKTQEKELQIAALQKEKGLITGLSITGGAVLLLILATFFLLWRWTVQKRRTTEKQKQLAEQQVKQLEQEKQLVATQSVLDGETQERVRLARDLHDGLGSMLTGAKLSLLELKKGVTLDFADVERFDKAVGLLDSSVHEMRRVAHHLMPDSLSRFGLKPAVSDFCDNLPFVRFDYYGDESRLDPKLEVMIYRSIHELVSNALKHAGASKISVQIIRESDRIAFTVEDDGYGFDPSIASQGMGLQNIRTRVASYNGVMNIDSTIGKGTEISVELKVEN